MSQPDEKKDSVEKKRKSQLRENIETILSAILIALLVRIFFIEAYKIPTGSMIPTLIEGDHLLVNKFIYGVRLPIVGWKLPAITSPKQGDIVVFHFPGYESPGVVPELIDLVTFGVFGLTNTRDKPRNFIKRTIGTPGDIVAFKGQKLFINNKLQPQSLVVHDELKKELLEIDHPEKYSVSPDTVFTEKYYFDKNKQFMGRGNEYVLTEKTGKTEHMIQLRNVERSRRYTDIPMLYIPKAGDRLTIKELRTENDIKKYEFILNDKTIGILDRSDERDLYHTYYDRIIPDINNSRTGSVSVTFDSDYYFMMGDNRDSSDDSRSWGLVHEDFIIGTPIVIYWPHDRFAIAPE